MTLRLPKRFVDSATQRGIKLSATDLNLLINATVRLDGWSFRQAPAFDSAGSIGTNPPYFGGNGGLRGSTPQRLGRWYIAHRDGCDVTISGTANAVSSEVLKVYFDNTIVATITPTANWTATITPSGYSDGQPIQVIVDVTRSGVSEIDVTHGSYLVDDIYTGPISLGGWVAPTTFAGVYSAAKLNAVLDAMTWLLNRMTLIPRIPRLATIYQIGPFSVQSNYPIWWGTVARNFTNEYARFDVYWTNYSAVGMRFQIYKNGVVAYTSPTRGPGTYYDVVGIAMSQALGTPAEFLISADVIDAGIRTGWKQSRWSITGAHAEKGTGYAYWTPPAPLAYGLYSASTLNTALNNIVTALNTIKARIDATPNVWSRVHAQRRYFSPYDDAQGYLHKRAVPNITRLGDRLVVYGKGVGLASGPAVPPVETTKILDDYEFLHNTGIVDGDKLETKAIYLDTIQEVPPTVDYYLTGTDVYLAEEYLV